MNEKCSYIRRDLKPHISDLSVTDDSILEIITKAVSEDTERQNRLGQTHKQKTLGVNVVQSEKEKITGQIQSEVQANRAAIQELTVQVSSLTKCLEGPNSRCECSNGGHPPHFSSLHTDNSKRGKREVSPVCSTRD